MTEENKDVQVKAAEEETNEEVKDEALVGPDGKELLFPDGPTISKVEEWKSLHGDIFLSEFGEDVYIWRIIRRQEYKAIMKVQSADAHYREERICEAVVLYPENYDFNAMANGKAGIPTLLGEMILEKSGFQATTGAMQL